jgi:hypothetical protein
MASKRFKKLKQQRETAQPQEQAPMPASEPEESDLQERYRHLDRTNAQISPGLAGTTGRRRNNATNPHVAKQETQVVNG